MAQHSTYIRHVLLYEFESGHPAAEAYRNRFKAGNKKLEDEPCTGRPTAIPFDELKNLAEQHPYEDVRNGEKARSVAPICIERRQRPKTPGHLHSAALQKQQIRFS
ncbi:hypothetical protein RB195_009306 [Necator americanus]|uniref:Mos1 transposase HTH domain-containing protein n=1 Tax=Necator americanus TaxID=51031 RepID=A0ABR1CVA8_NECAM